MCLLPILFVWCLTYVREDDIFDFCTWARLRTVYSLVDPTTTEPERGNVSSSSTRTGYEPYRNFGSSRASSAIRFQKLVD